MVRKQTHRSSPVYFEPISLILIFLLHKSRQMWLLTLSTLYILQQKLSHIKDQLILLPEQIKFLKLNNGNKTIIVNANYFEVKNCLILWNVTQEEANSCKFHNFSKECRPTCTCILRWKTCCIFLPPWFLP